MLMVFKTAEGKEPISMLVEDVNRIKVAAGTDVVVIGFTDGQWVIVKGTVEEWTLIINRAMALKGEG